MYHNYDNHQKMDHKPFEGLVQGRRSRCMVVVQHQPMIFSRSSRPQKVALEDFAKEPLAMGFSYLFM